MIFELQTQTDAVLTTFTGRTEKHGEDDVPAMSFGLKINGANTLLDLLSPTLRSTLYKPVDDQNDLPGIEPTTPMLRSKDLTAIEPDYTFEGWTTTIEYGIKSSNEEGSTALVMGGCKVDAFKINLYEGGTVDINFRVSTSDIDEAGVGMLWRRQKKSVVVLVKAPKASAPTIDGTTAAFETDHPGAAKAQTDLLDSAPAKEPDAGEVFAAAHGEAGRGDGKDWPFPGTDAGATAPAADAAAQPASRSSKAKRGAAPE